MIVKAIQKVSIADSHGKRTTLYVPGHVTKQNLADAMHVAEFQSIKFCGMFTAIRLSRIHRVHRLV